MIFRPFNDVTNDEPTILPLEVFTCRNFAADFFRQKSNFTGKKTAKSRFVPPFGGLRGNVHGSSMARYKARIWLPISDIWTFFAISHVLEALWGDICRNRCVRKGGGSLWAQISRGIGSPTNDCWRQKTKALSTPATRSKQRSTLSNQQSTL